MTLDRQAIFDAALALPEAERCRLVEQLLATLPPEGTKEEFAAELDRRHAEFQRDPIVGIPWSEVKRQT